MLKGNLGNPGFIVPLIRDIGFDGFVSLLNSFRITEGSACDIGCRRIYVATIPTARGRRGVSLLLKRSGRDKRESIIYRFYPKIPVKKVHIALSYMVAEATIDPVEPLYLTYIGYLRRADVFSSYSDNVFTVWRGVSSSREYMLYIYIDDQDTIHVSAPRSVQYRIDLGEVPKALGVWGAEIYWMTIRRRYSYTHTRLEINLYSRNYHSTI